MAERIGPGRPPRDPYDVIDYVTKVDDDGVERIPVRMLDRVVETLANNGFLHDAAARAGVSKETLRQWIRKGSEAKADLIAGRLRLSQLDIQTRRCIELADAVEYASATARTQMLQTMTAMAQGGLSRSKITERYDAEGKVTERAETVETTLPDPRALAWILTHRYRDEFTAPAEHAGAGGALTIDMQSPRDRLLSHIADVRSRRALPPGKDVIDASSRDTNGDH